MQHKLLTVALAVGGVLMDIDDVFRLGSPACAR
jgi:hypothetical protein